MCRDRDRECVERLRVRVKVVGGSVCLEREMERVLREREGECFEIEGVCREIESVYKGSVC